MATKSAATKPVIVTTEHRGVFYGFVPNKAPLDVTVIRIERVRMVVYWSADVRGVVGLAATGPTNGCRIEFEAPAVTLQDVTAVIEVSEEAAKKFADAPWSK